MLEWTHVLPVSLACSDASLRVHVWDAAKVPESILLSPLLTLGNEICSNVDFSCQSPSGVIWIFFCLLFKKIGQGYNCYLKVPLRC